MNNILNLKCPCGGAMGLSEVVSDTDAGTVYCYTCTCGRSVEILGDGYTITETPAGEVETGVLVPSDVDMLKMDGTISE